jgi:hypothetical protein
MEEAVLGQVAESEQEAANQGLEKVLQATSRTVRKGHVVQAKRKNNWYAH